MQLKQFMSEFEHQPSRMPEQFYDEVLLWRPPLPVDRIDFSGLFDPEKIDPKTLEEVPGYAWDRLPRWITEIEDTFKRTPEKPVVCIDLCSSVPLNAQMLRALEFRRSGERGREIVGHLFHEDSYDEMQEPATRALHYAVSGDETIRRLLESAVQAVLYTRNSYDMAEGDVELASERLAARLGEVLPNQTVSYEQEISGRNQETSWGLYFSSVNEDRNYLEALALIPLLTARARETAKGLEAAIVQHKLDHPDEVSTTKKERRLARQQRSDQFKEQHARDIQLARETKPAGETLAREYMAWQIDVITKQIAGNDRYRPARFLSLDLARRDAIAASSLHFTSDATQATNLYTHAVRSLFDPRQHLAGDMFEPLPVPDNSLTFITIYDGWPFGSSFDNQEWGEFDREDIEACISVAVDRLFNFYQKLTYGGKLVIFPWATFDNDANSAEILRRVTGELSLLTGHGVNRPLFHVASLEELMSESELTYTKGLSAIFDDEENNFLEALIVEKPDRDLVKRHAKALGRRMIIAGRIQDLPDPTQ